MKKLFLFFTVFLTFFSCKEKPVPVSGESSDFAQSSVSHNNDSVIQDVNSTRRIVDVDSLSVTPRVAYLKKSVGNNHFSLKIDLPHYDHGEIDMNILSWINMNLEDEIRDSIDFRTDPDLTEDFNAYKASFNMKYDGSLSDLDALCRFYADKHFELYKGDRLGIDYNIECKKVFENKDVVSYEVTEFFSNYAMLKTKNLIRGTTFFKYNGKRLTWAYFENTNVKNIIKKEVNRQYLRFSPDSYEEFLRTTKYHEFSLPVNPPYMTKQGLKFVYMLQELSPKEQDGQISCIVQPEAISLSHTLIEMLH